MAPLQCSCLENPRDGGAWWASVYGVAQSQTRLKRLSSSSSSNVIRRAQGAPRKNEIYTTFKKSRERVFRDKRSGDNENQG